jgi:hypothetical protein
MNRNGPFFYFDVYGGKKFMIDEITTKILPASELKRCVWGLLVHLDAEYQKKLEKYEEELKTYLRHLGKKEEQVIEVKPIGFLEQRLEGSSQHQGFSYTKYGQTHHVLRPEKPSPPGLYRYRGYYRNGDYTEHARGIGLLANSLVNRNINPTRVENYRQKMQAGLWRDLLSDPITITFDGDVVNGQHRLGAVWGVDWKKAPNDPLFLLVIGASPEEALLADTSKRTAHDQAVITAKLLSQRDSAK